MSERKSGIGYSHPHPLPKLTHPFSFDRGRQEKGVLFAKRRKAKNNKDLVGFDAELLQEKINRCWDCINDLPVQIRLDTNLMFLEGGIQEKGDAIDEFVLLIEMCVDSLYHFQFLQMRFEQQIDLIKLEEEREREQNAHHVESGLGEGGREEVEEEGGGGIKLLNRRRRNRKRGRKGFQSKFRPREGGKLFTSTTKI